MGIGDIVLSNIIEKVEKTINKYNLIIPGDKVVLAVSGGPDSISMLDILLKIKERKFGKSNPEPMATLVVAHVNHMIRDEADSDEAFVRDYCEKNNIEFYSKSIDVKKLANNSKIGVEEAGRIARYDFFDEVMQKTNANRLLLHII